MRPAPAYSRVRFAGAGSDVKKISPGGPTLFQAKAPPVLPVALQRGRGRSAGIDRKGFGLSESDPAWEQWDSDHDRAGAEDRGPDSGRPIAGSMDFRMGASPGTQD